MRIGRYFRGNDLSPLASALLRFKYVGDRSAGHRLRRLFALAAHTLPAHFDVVVPVPLHPKRLRQRGYNQAAWLARGSARALRLVLLPRALARVHDTAPQASVGAGQRRALQGAFRSTGPGIAGKTVLLIDDVFTTGATAADAAAALLAGGARRVGLAVLLVAGHDAQQ